MKRPELRLSAIATLVLLACAACSSGSDDGIDVTTSWLGSLHRYERVSGTEQFGVYLMKGGTRPAHVGQIIVGSAEITISARSDLNAISPAAYEELRAAFAKALEREAAQRFAAKPGASGPADTADTYILRAALTNLTVKRKSRNFGPVGLNDLEFTFDDAAIELVLHEKRSNARRGVIVQKAEGPVARRNALADRFRSLAARAAEKTAEARDGINRKAALPVAPALAPAKPSEPSKK
jgi:hypothetical protein